MLVSYGSLFIGGEWVRPSSPARIDVTSASTEEFIGSVPEAQEADVDDAVRIANDSDYGLAGGVYSASEERATALARRIRTGQVEINGAAFNPLAPFGGYKLSGHGRELGPYGVEEFLVLKSMQL